MLPGGNGNTGTLFEKELVEEQVVGLIETLPFFNAAFDILSLGLFEIWNLSEVSFTRHDPNKWLSVFVDTWGMDLAWTTFVHRWTDFKNEKHARKETAKKIIKPWGWFRRYANLSCFPTRVFTISSSLQYMIPVNFFYSTESGRCGSFRNHDSLIDLMDSTGGFGLQPLQPLQPLQHQQLLTTHLSTALKEFVCA